MEIEKKISWVKSLTVAVAEIALILVTLIFTTNISPEPHMRIILGTLAIIAIIYLGLIGIESIGTEKENLRVTEKANKVINAAADFGKTIDAIYNKVNDTENKNEMAISEISQALNIILDYIKLQNIEAPEIPKKKK